MDKKLEISNQLSALGYTPPQTSWTRHDPRGAEYGTYQVRVSATMTNYGDICVSYYPSGSNCEAFRFYFTTFDSFERWTKHTF